MADYTLLIFYSTLALGVSFLCSILEAVVLSIPQTYVSVLEKDKKRTAAMWSYLKDDDSVRPLTAILTLNTVAHTMGAAGVGSEVAKQFGDSALTVASVILTCCFILLRDYPEDTWCCILETPVDAIGLCPYLVDKNARHLDRAYPNAEIYSAKGESINCYPR